MPAELVTYQDTVALAEQFPPGTLVPAAKLHARYAELMTAAGRPVHHATVLGHALRRANWDRKRVRKSVGGKIRDTASWVVPGKRALSDEDAHVYDALASLGEGIHPNTLIYARYQALARKHGWRDTMNQNALQRWLTRKGFVRMTEKGQPSRFVDHKRVEERA